MPFGKDKDKKKKKGKQGQGPNLSSFATLSQTARTGNFFRTVSFKIGQLEGGSDSTDNGMAVWREAIEHPTSNRWRVFEVKRQPELETVGTNSNGKAIHRRLIDDCEELTLDEALENLLQYENSQSSLGYAASSDTPEDYGNQHVMAFALNEGRAPDLNGNLHAAYNGRIVTEGAFSEDILDRVRKVYENPPAQSKEPSLAETPLSVLFGRAEASLDVTRMIDIIKDQKKWYDLVQAVGTAMSKLIDIQDGGRIRLDHRNRNDEYQHSARDLLYRETDFIDAMAALRKCAADNLIAGTDAEKAFFDKLINKIQLSLEIAYAKSLYQSAMGDGLSPHRGPNIETTEKLQKQIEYVSQCLREVGGSETDVKRLHADIMQPSKPFKISDMCDSERLAHFRNSYHFDTTDYHGSEKEIIYFPQVLIDCLEQCDQVTEHLQKSLEAEKDRITNQKSSPSDESDPSHLLKTDETKAVDTQPYSKVERRFDGRNGDITRSPGWGGPRY